MISCGANLRCLAPKFSLCVQLIQFLAFQKNQTTLKKQAAVREFRGRLLAISISFSWRDRVSLT